MRWTNKKETMCAQSIKKSERCLQCKHNLCSDLRNLNIEALKVDDVPEFDATVVCTLLSDKKEGTIACKININFTKLIRRMPVR